MVKRVRQLAADDQRMLDVLDTLICRLDTLAKDLESLRAAIAVEEDLGAQLDEPRMRRLMVVLQEKEAAENGLQSALRDLHVELTMRADQDHGPLLARMNDVLLDLTVDSEIASDIEAQTPKKDRLSVLKQNLIVNLNQSRQKQPKSHSSSTALT